MFWVSVAWDWYAAHSDKVNPIVAALGGAALVWAAITQARTATNRHYEQTRADQQRRITESFSKAVEQLGSEKMEVRLGGIYTLERLAIEAIAQARSTPWWRRFTESFSKAVEQLSSEQIEALARSRPWWRRLWRYNRPLPDPVSDLYWTVMETLTAFVRVQTRWKEPEASASGMPEPDIWPEPSTDIAAVLEVIHRRPDAGRQRETQRRWRFDLSKTDLRGASLPGAHLEHAKLNAAHLERANLAGAHLEDAELHLAYLEGASLEAAHLEHAVLRVAHLEHARLAGAHLEGAFLSLAHLEHAHLARAHLEGAKLYEAHLENADLYEAHLENADLSEAHLEGTNLSWAIGNAKTRTCRNPVERPARWPPYEPD